MFPGAIRLQGAGESRRSIPARPALEGKAFCLIAAAFAGYRPRLSISRGKTQSDFFQKMTYKVELCANKDMYQYSLRYQYNAWSENACLPEQRRGYRSIHPAMIFSSKVEIVDAFILESIKNKTIVLFL